MARAGDAAITTAFLAEFLTGGRWQPLSRMTSAPVVRPLGPGTASPADLHVVPGLPRPPGLVLVHGLAEAGKDDPRLREEATRLARAGWAVGVPTVPGLAVMRLRPDDARSVVGALQAVLTAGHAPVAIVGVSVGAAPAIIGAATAETVIGSPPPVSAILLLGGYASMREVLRFTLTGTYRDDVRQETRTVNEEAIALFARANPDLLDEHGRALVENRDSSRVDALMANLPPSTRALLDALSPETHLPRIGAPLFLVHGRADPVVPFTESLRLEHVARAGGRPARLAVVGTVDHVERGTGVGLRELWRLWTIFYAFRLVARG
jgi:pimeloyl-ACP methyl ester carboxylesterase